MNEQAPQHPSEDTPNANPFVEPPLYPHQESTTSGEPLPTTPGSLMDLLRQQREAFDRGDTVAAHNIGAELRDREERITSYTAPLPEHEAEVTHTVPADTEISYDSSAAEPGIPPALARAFGLRPKKAGPEESEETPLLQGLKPYRVARKRPSGTKPEKKQVRLPDNLDQLSVGALKLITRQNTSPSHKLDVKDQASLDHYVGALDGAEEEINKEWGKGYTPPNAAIKNPENRPAIGTHLYDMFSADSEAAVAAGTVMTPEAMDLIKALAKGQKKFGKKSYYGIKIEKLRQDLNKQKVPPSWEIADYGRVRPTSFDENDKIGFGDFLIQQFQGRRYKDSDKFHGVLKNETYSSPHLRAKASLAIGSVALARTLRPKVAKTLQKSKQVPASVKRAASQHLKELRDEASYPTFGEQEAYFRPTGEGWSELPAIPELEEPEPEAESKIRQMSPETIKHMDKDQTRAEFPNDADLNYFWNLQQRLLAGEKPDDSEKDA